MNTPSLILGAAEYAAWIAIIYFMATDTFAGLVYMLMAWAEKMEAKFDD